MSVNAKRCAENFATANERAAARQVKSVSPSTKVLLYLNGL